MIREQQKEMHFTEQSQKEQSVGEFDGMHSYYNHWPYTPITIFSNKDEAHE